MYTAGVTLAAVLLVLASFEGPPEVQRPTGAAPEVQRPSAPANLSEGTASAAPAADLSGGTAPAGAAPVDLSGGTAPTGAAPATPAPARRVYRRPVEEGVVTVGATPLPPSDGMPRYHRAPFADTVWPKLVGRDVLMVLGTGARECVTLTKKTNDALYFNHRKHGPQQAPLGAVTSLHENSWECQSHDETPSEWARSGAAAGLGMGGLGLLMGVLYDVDNDPKCIFSDDEAVRDTCKSTSPLQVPHYMYAVIGVTTTTLATPVAAIGARSTSRDLRVKGKLWARATGWTLYAAGTLLNVLWFAGFYGDVEPLQSRGMAAGAGALGLGGAAFMAVDALMSRQELIQLRAEDARPRSVARRGPRLSFGARPLGHAGQMHGLGLGLGGRF